MRPIACPHCSEPARYDAMEDEHWVCENGHHTMGSEGVLVLMYPHLPYLRGEK